MPYDQETPADLPAKQLGTASRVKPAMCELDETTINNMQQGRYRSCCKPNCRVVRQSPQHHRGKPKRNSHCVTTLSPMIPQQGSSLHSLQDFPDVKSKVTHTMQLPASCNADRHQQLTPRCGRWRQWRRWARPWLSRRRCHDACRDASRACVCRQAGSTHVSVTVDSIRRESAVCGTVGQRHLTCAIAE